MSFLNKALGAFFSLLVVGLSASASVMPVTVSGNVTTLSNLKADLAEMARLSVRTGATGDILAKLSQRVPVGNGSVVVDVVAKVPKAKVIEALGRFLGKTLPVLTTGKAIYDLGEELGFGLDNSSGPLVVTKTKTLPGDPLGAGGCCFTSYLSGRNGNGATPAGAVQDAINQVASIRQDIAYELLGPMENTGGAGFYTNLYSVSAGVRTFVAKVGVMTGGTAGPVGNTGGQTVKVPSSVGEFLDALDKKTDFKPDSKFDDAAADALGPGETYDFEPSGVTGPKSEPGQSSTTINSGNNSTTTNTTNNNFTYGPNNVSVTQTTTGVTVDNSTGAIIGGSTTTTSPVTQTQQLPAEDPCLAHPNRNGCREDEFDTPDDKIPKKDKTITFEAENLGFGGGSCPADVIMTPRGMNRPVKVVNWVDNCQKITTYAKPMILALAMFGALVILFAGGMRND